MRVAALLVALALPAGAQQATLLTDATDTPFPSFGGEWALTDHHGQARTQADPAGRVQLLFFGYATCEAICTVALPTMSDLAADLAAEGIEVAPLVVTVDPARDTVESMGPALATYAPGLTGLTGSEESLAHVRDLFHVERTLLFEEPLGGAVYAHGSHIFVLDGDGAFLTLLPPILAPEAMVEIVRGYAG
ncbi:SCO family protein [Jannaschia sp. Os4]|uniref:SCO family protein n=1 Tax=Jannaschia sp. Os4 TaxID=2807617 RepID=UPI00193AB4D7|nr:SCO family protein [Jannaschia sp. Os4]MBM2577331.1 SCO family protein [Jannaschia sp. Os4]